MEEEDIPPQNLFYDPRVTDFIVQVEDGGRIDRIGPMYPSQGTHFFFLFDDSEKRR